MNRLDHLLVLTLATYGLCYILMYGSIFNRPRNFLMRKFRWFQRLITCPLCTGFWCGLVTYNWHLSLQWLRLMDCLIYLQRHLCFPLPAIVLSSATWLHLFTEILLAKAYPSVDASRCPQDEEGVDDKDFQI